MLRSCTVGGRVPLDHVGGCRPLVVGYTVKVVGVGHPYRNRNRNRNRAGHPQGNGGASVVVATCCGFICPVLRRVYSLINGTFCVEIAPKWGVFGRFWAGYAPKSYIFAGLRIKFCGF